MEIRINGRLCACEKGEFILKVAQRNGFEIPTLCHHEALSEQGSCRLCLVEVLENGKSKVVVSCVYPIERPCEVLTDSDKIKQERAMVLMLLRMRAPESLEIRELCIKYAAVETNRLRALDGEKCILCGLCARACASLGTGAISTINRGITKKVSTPYEEPNIRCVGCGSCASVCPTKAIPLTEQEGVRHIWGRDFPLVRCKECGAFIGTAQEIDRAMRNLHAKTDGLCSICRQKKMTDVLAHTYGISSPGMDSE